MFVRSWMSRPVISVDPEASVYDAAKVMERKSIRRLAVVSDGRLVGIVTRSDLQATVGKSRRPDAGARKSQRIRIGNVMTRKPITVEADDTLEQAAQVMLRKSISGLPVLDDGRLVGFITESDVFRSLCTILGFRQGGARMVMSIPNSGDLLRDVKRAVGRFDIQGLVAYNNPGKKRWEAVIRLKGKQGAATRKGS